MFWRCFFFPYLLFLIVGCGSEQDYASIKSEDVFTSSGPEIVKFATSQQIDSDEVVRHQYIVGFKGEPGRYGHHFSSFATERRAHLSRLHRTLRNFASPSIRYLTSIDLGSLDGNYWHGRFPGLGSQVISKPYLSAARAPSSIVSVQFDSEEEARRSLVRWVALDLIWYAEPDYTSKLSMTVDNFSEYNETYNGYEQAGASWFSQVNLQAAFSSLTQKGISPELAPIIAVMDSGVDYQHPALADRMWENPAQNQASCINDKYGCNTTQQKKGLLGNGDVFPARLSSAGVECDDQGSACQHGTHVAGIIAASPQTEYAGICPVCKILAVKIVGLTRQGRGKPDTIADSSIIAGFSYISRFRTAGINSVRIVNASFGKFQRSQTVEMLIRQLKDLGQGILVVAAAGNEDTMKRQYPAAFNDVISVANIMSDTGVKSDSSNFGPWVDVAAPGDTESAVTGCFRTGILSTVPGGGSECLSGSSMAAPIVSGIAGLIVAANPNINISDLRDRLVSTARTDIYDQSGNQAYFPTLKDTGQRIRLLGSGVVDADRSINYENSSPKGSVPSNSRVTPSCSVIAGMEGTIAWFIFILPVALLTVFRRKFN